ncbi:hypothetical protein FB567DRAFT_603485 [Paraphoma chrysanthemicola]|uniref:Ubiquitin 3 binding protein But2 C-terminal domain-containing protein n=1 Tax=Paraphoma chrysanthemicola TaxID=798071 RepID=A0A8K0VXA4_9PLEO|nr:hypothetical protein FB567DRAFT_603485 [Paraphoma chrysanthemicola]
MAVLSIESSLFPDFQHTWVVNGWYMKSFGLRPNEHITPTSSYISFLTVFKVSFFNHLYLFSSPVIMKSTLFASILLFATSSLSAPVSQGTPSLSTRNSTAPASSSQTTTVYPNLQVQWRSTLPTRKGSNTNAGRLLTSPFERIHTAVNIQLGPQQIPDNVERKQCKLVFHLSQNDWAVNQLGNAPPKFDIYRLDGCLNEAYSWATPLARGAQIGTLTPKKGGAAEWQSVDMRADTIHPPMGAAPTFACERGEYSFEMIAHSGANFGWSSGSGSGLRIEISD